MRLESITSSKNQRLWWDIPTKVLYSAKLHFGLQNGAKIWAGLRLELRMGLHQGGG